MSNNVLVTDSLFIKDHHVKLIENAGYKVTRLDKPAASEAELCEAIKGKVGYIIGGIEKVTDAVIEASDELKAIVFTGTGYKGFIPGYKKAFEKGIYIGNAPYINAPAVAEFGLALTVAMCRELFAIKRGGTKGFVTTRSISEMKVGILGLGHIGKEYLRMIKGLGASDIQYANRTRYADLEKEYSLGFVTKEKLFKNCDVIFVALAKDGPGAKYVNSENLESMKQDAILVTTSDPELFDLDALYKVLESGRIRAAFDENITEDRFLKLPLPNWYTPTESSAFNTGQTIEDVSQSCVETLLNLLSSGNDKYKVNPE